jgi:sulfur-oxidizing protein SoxY
LQGVPEGFPATRPASGRKGCAGSAVVLLDLASGTAEVTGLGSQPKESPVASEQSSSRRSFLRACLLTGAGLIGSSGLLRGERLLAFQGPAGDPGDPEVPNEEVARILKGLFGDRPIRKGHISLDMPAVAEDGRIVPLIIESDLPMTPESYVKAVHLIVDHNPDPHLAAYYLTPALGSVAIQSRIKMKRTTWVRAILETSAGDVWAAYAHVNVSLNGCG